MTYSTIIALDVSDQKSNICVMTKEGGEKRILVETVCPTSKAGFTEAFSKFDHLWPVIFETGTHCRWMERLFKSLGFRPVVANPAKLPTITKSNHKNDKRDARELASLGLADLELLHPVKLRDEVYQQMMRLHAGRNALIGCRTKIINQVRGFAKSIGFRIEECSTERFHKLDTCGWPQDLVNLHWPMRDTLETINLKIKAYEAQIKDFAQTEPFGKMVERVQQVVGVGWVGATMFIAAIGGNPDKFEKARDVGPFLGLTPKQDQSGDMNKQLPITKAGCDIMRPVLLECAHAASKDKTRDSDMKAKYMRIAGDGSSGIAKKKAYVAVARKLAVTMLALLKKPDREYVPLSEKCREDLERMRAEIAYRTMSKVA